MRRVVCSVTINLLTTESQIKRDKDRQADREEQNDIETDQQVTDKQDVSRQRHT